MGLHTSVKAHINVRRPTFPAETDVVHEENEATNTISVDTNPTVVTALSVLERTMSLDSASSHGPGFCDGNIPCLPMLSSAAKAMASNGTRPTAEAPPPSDMEGMSNDSGNHDVMEESINTSTQSRKRKTSIVCDHFDKININGEDKTVCKHCKKSLSGKSSNGTNHLKSHIKSCKELEGTPNSRIEGSARSSKFDESLAKKELASMIIMHEYPLSIVDHVGFKKYSKALRLSFVVPCRNTIKKEIFKIYEFEKEKTMALVEKNHSRIALTTDMWTASNQRRGFMAITAHFIDDSWNLQSRLLRFVHVPCPHDANTICSVLLDCLYSWKVHQNLLTLTVDNCSTNDAMIELLKTSLGSSSLLVDGKFLHMRCAAHIMNLIVKDGLDVIRDSIETIRASVAYWTTGPKREEMFITAASEMHVQCSRKLVLDCRTRWNSTYLMLQSALEYKAVFPLMSIRCRGYKNVPTEDDWKLVVVIAEKLHMFYKVTQLFSGTQYPTSNLFFPKVCNIKLSITKWLDSDVPQVRTMAMQMEEKFEKYWSVIGTIAIATILDPRYKMKAIEFFFRKIYPTSYVVEIEKIRVLLYDLVKEYESCPTLSFIADAPSGSLSWSGVNDEDDDMDQYDVFVSDTSRVNDKSDLDKYLGEAVIPRNDKDFDIISWWKTSRGSYHTLHMVARDVLAIPISTVASESAFSIGGRVINPHRNRLHSNTVEALMCARDWLRSEFGDATLLGTFDDDVDEGLSHVDADDMI